MDILGAGISVVGAIIFLIKKIFNSKKEDNIKTINISYSRDMVELIPQQIKSEEHGTLNDDMLRLVDRFIAIYSNHGILINQIPSFINPNFGLKLSDFKDRQSILQILDDEIINWTCKTFGIQRAWMDGKSKRIYKHVDYYKNIMTCIDDIIEIKNLYKDSFEVFLLRIIN